MRGHQWGGYYRRDVVDRPDVIFGVHWLNSYDCGSYVDEYGVRQGISFAIFFSSDFPDSGGKFSEAFDVSLGDADIFCQDPLLQAAVAGVPVEDISNNIAALPWLPWSVKELLADDVASGLSPMEIFERRAGVLNYRFLGFTFDEVLQTNPLIWQPAIDDETGVEIANVFKCSLEGQQ